MKSALLANRTLLRIAGPDRKAFLQGLVSNDMHLCEPGKALAAALLTPQGKFLFDLILYETGEYLLVECEAERHEALLRLLSHHKLRSDVALEALGDSYEVFAVWDTATLRCDGGFAFTDPRLETLGLRVFAPQRAADTLRAGNDFAAYDTRRIALNIPDGSRDLIPESSPLLEGNFDLLNGVSWSKGCYLGQELTARMHYRALVKKRLFPVNIAGLAPLSGTPVFDGEQEIGTLRSSRNDVGLAALYGQSVKRAVRAKGSFRCGAVRLTPFLPDWMQDVSF